MVMEQTVTIINNSGKIISTGKHLVNIFKDAKAAYQEKKATLRSQRSFGMKRAQTFDVGASRGGPILYEADELSELPSQHQHRFLEDRRRSSHDDLDRRSHASSRRSSRRSHGGGSEHGGHHGGHHGSRSHGGGGKHKSARPPLTETNLRTLSEVSSTAPSATVVPKAYRSPYAETAPRDLALSRPTLHGTGGPPTTHDSTPVSSPRHSLAVGRPRSDPSLRQRAKSVDMNLAYGNIPPDLASRTDLDPVSGASSQHEAEARTLMGRIEGLLTEAQCLHHTASAIISNLQTNPEAAAAVALTLAELSALLAKTSPGFLGVVKSGSPAIFALLASPQFLIGTGIAVGVTVVMFGGWKIIQRMREKKAVDAAAAAAAQAFEMHQVPGGVPPGPAGGAQGFARGASFGGSQGFDEAYVIDDDLSTIESWRRGIVPFGEDESVDVELISPEAMRSRVGADAKSVRTAKTAKTAKSHRTHKSSRSHRSGSSRGGDEYDVPERKSSRGKGKEVDGESRHKDSGSSSAVSGSGSGTSAHHRGSKVSASSSKRGERLEVKAIEDGSRAGDEGSLDMMLRPKEKKNSMLKQLFKKKKDKDDRERSEVSVMA